MSAYLYAFFENDIMQYVGVTTTQPQCRIYSHKYEAAFLDLFDRQCFEVRCLKVDTLWGAAQIEYGQILRYKPALNKSGRTRAYVPPVELVGIWRKHKDLFHPILTPIRWKRATQVPVQLQEYRQIKNISECWLSRRAVSIQCPPPLTIATDTEWEEQMESYMRDFVL